MDTAVDVACLHHVARAAREVKSVEVTFHVAWFRHLVNRHGPPVDQVIGSVVVGGGNDATLRPK